MAVTEGAGDCWSGDVEKLIDVQLGMTQRRIQVDGTIFCTCSGRLKRAVCWSGDVEKPIDAPSDSAELRICRLFYRCRESWTVHRCVYYISGRRHECGELCGCPVAFYKPRARLSHEERHDHERACLEQHTQSIPRRSGARASTTI